MAKQTLEAQNPLILRCNRLMEAFAKSDDERDFYLDRLEGFLIYADLDKTEEELSVLEKELEKNKDRYCMIPKLTFYETKKIMEGFINEKVYDIDTKEKLLDIIQSKEARENFLEFIYDHHAELEKWQAFYQERSRIRIIEWLRANHFNFVFEEDLEFPKILLERLKKELFQTKVGKDILNARKTLIAKAKTYYSNEALNPRPKRGRPPKQIQKAEIEPQITTDIFITVPNGLRGFLFIPDLTGPSSATFSSKFGNEEDLYTHRRTLSDTDLSMENLNQKLATLRTLSTKWRETEDAKKLALSAKSASKNVDFDELDEDEDEEFELESANLNGLKTKNKKGMKVQSQVVVKGQKTQKITKPLSSKVSPTPTQKPSKLTKPALKAKPFVKKSAMISKSTPKPKPSVKAKPAAKLASQVKTKTKAKVSSKPQIAKPQPKKVLRPIMKLKKKS